ncbi:swr1 complex component [Trapelia coarctata]|nr:swr1 complex component [Trapelia coarctata]
MLDDTFGNRNVEPTTPPKPNFEIRVKPLDLEQFQHASSIEDSSCENQNDGPPSKKRKLAGSVTPQRSTSRPLSPPWKRIAVEGPTSFVEGGRRKSSRTNPVPLELQPQSDKRRTRAAIQHTTATKSKYGGASIHKPSPLTPLSAQSHTNGKPRFSTKSTAPPANKSPAKLQSQNKSSTNGHVDSKPITKRSHKKKHSGIPQSLSFLKIDPGSPKKTRGSVRISDHAPRKTMSQEEDFGQENVRNGWHNSDEELEQDEDDDEREEDEDDEDDDMDDDVPLDPNFKPQRLNLRVHMPTVTVQHPAHVVQPKVYSSFREWLQNDDPLEGSDAKHLTDKEARKEARMRQRILDAAEPGGVLSLGKCSKYEPEAQEEPHQFTHHDHLVAHAIYFRKLMNKEYRDHANAARKLSIAVVEKWRHNDPHSIAEANRRYWDTSYKPMYQQCIKDLSRKWELFRAEVRHCQLKKWEEEQDVLGKEALGKMLEKSTRLLDKRRRGSSVGASTIGDGDESERSDDASGSEADSKSESEDEKNMSSSQSESEEGSQDNAANEDDGLTVDEIRRKYADQPTENLDRPPDETAPQPFTPSVNIEQHAISPSTEKYESPLQRVADNERSAAQDYPTEMDENMLDESDESTDMDDDTEDSEGSSEDDEAEDDEASDEDQGHGLLGFFSKTDLEAERNAIEPAVTSGAEDDELEEVQLIPDATQVQTPSASNSEAPSIDVRKQLKKDPSDEDSHPFLSTTEVKADDSRLVNSLAINKPSCLATYMTPEQPMEIEPNSMPATPVSSKTLRTQVPSLLRGTLREYQHYGLDWLAGLYANGTNGILADEMGLGKTIQTISLLAHLAVEHGTWGPHLIVVPTSVMLNWEMEFKKFLPGFKILTYYGTQDERRLKRKGWLDNDKWNVVITSYQLVLQDQGMFKRRGWHYLVLDEAHNIKNFRSQRWQTLLNFKTHARLLLTGTPLQNNLTELWSLLFFLMPTDSTETGIAGFTGLQDFTSWFKKPVDQILEQGRETMDDEARELVHKLHDVLRPFLLRRLKADVEKQMPGKHEHVVYCKLSKRQRYLYDGFMSRTQTKETLARGNYLSIINCLMQLRKVCNHPDLFETRQIVTSFAMPRSAVADFEIKELLIRRRLLQEDVFQNVSLDVVNLLPSANGPVSALDTIQNCRLGALGRLRQLVSQQMGRILPKMEFDGTTIPSTLAYMENNARVSALEGLQQRSYLTSLRSQRRPLMSYGLIQRLRIGALQLPVSPMPKRRAQISEWLSSISPAMQDMVLTLPRRAEAMQPAVSKFACVTPAVVAPDISELTLTRRGIGLVQEVKQVCSEDSFHEARMRLSIAFPDKRLLQYDCGKLQRLDTLLRTLQAGGHRALIFTQMTKVLDILEQFLNIHGHRYLRLDGATKIEQRQILTDRFNNDNRILAFILSSRSGGLGINLTGADTVIFYDLDWNPAMDKQCQDRCHRIGQTRDVHIYRFVSEHTIEANILRKANQKRMLDDVVIQEGDFTTDYFNKPNIKDALDEEGLEDGHDEASAAMDRVLGTGPGNPKLSSKIFEEAEDKEDIDAAKVAEKEMAQADEADFDERTASGSIGTPKTPGPGTATPGNFAARVGLSRQAVGGVKAAAEAIFVDDETLHSPLPVPSSVMAADIFTEKDGIGIDHYMVEFLERELKDVPIVPPADKTKAKAKKVGEHRVRRAR